MTIALCFRASVDPTPDSAANMLSMKGIGRTRRDTAPTRRFVQGLDGIVMGTADPESLKDCSHVNQSWVGVPGWRQCVDDLLSRGGMITKHR